MALVSCKECNNKVSDTALVCPRCGFVMKIDRVAESNKQSSRVMFILLGIVLMAIGFYLLASSSFSIAIGS